MLAHGSRVGPYELAGHIGSGAMGEVYRAHDVRLGRDVAIKVLAEPFRLDTERRARFEREARLLAALNHPNIETLHGVEEHESAQALVLELVEGKTLAEHIAAGRIDVPEALEIGRQIAAGLEAAHAQGVIHRDLKPQNVKLRPDGRVKLLDFGLAKVFAPSAGAGPALATVTAIDIVRAGHAVGTPAYMSPEQVRGLEVDARADIWAFGCVCYEMLTGVRPFPGQSSSDVFATITDSPPDFDRLPEGTPASIRRMLRRCLEKRPERRLRSMGDALLEIDDASRELGQSGLGRALRPRRALAWGAFGVGCALGIVTPSMLREVARQGAAAPQAVVTSITADELRRMNIDDADRSLAVSADGTTLVFAGNDRAQLFVRRLDRLQVEPLTPPSSGVRGPFFSPDGRWVGYIEGNTALRKVALAGNLSTGLIVMDGPSRGATWSPDGTIVYATSNTATGLQRISADGGTAEVLTRPNADDGEADHVFPYMLPGGGAVLMTVVPRSRRVEDGHIAVLDLETREWQTVLDGGYDARYANGWLLYMASSELFAAPFDVERHRVLGPSVRALSGARIGADVSSNFDVAQNGTLAYLDAKRSAGGRYLTWVDRSGRETRLDVPRGPYSYPRVSPDGRRVAVYVRDEARDRDIWTIDLQQASMTRLTFGPEIDSWPIWLSNDRIAFSSQRASGIANVFIQETNGGTEASQLTESASMLLVPAAVAADESALILSARNAAGWDVQLLPLPSSSTLDDDGSVLPRALPGLDGEASERNAVISPDGRWIAYESDSVGARFEVFVRPFPDTDAGLWQISRDGGQQPLWSPSGDELFYLGLDGTMFATVVSAGSGTWSAATPQALFAGEYVLVGGGNIGRQYDMAPDGERFLMIEEAGVDAAAINQIVVVQNWTGNLE